MLTEADVARNYVECGPPYIGESTFRNKDTVKANGGRWNAEYKKWEARSREDLRSMIASKAWTPCGFSSLAAYYMVEHIDKTVSAPSALPVGWCKLLFHRRDGDDAKFDATKDRETLRCGKVVLTRVCAARAVCLSTLGFSLVWSATVGDTAYGRDAKHAAFLFLGRCEQTHSPTHSTRLFVTRRHVCLWTSGNPPLATHPTGTGYTGRANTHPCRPGYHHTNAFTARCSGAQTVHKLCTNCAQTVHSCACPLYVLSRFALCAISSGAVSLLRAGGVHDLQITDEWVKSFGVTTQHNLRVQ